MYAVKVKQKSLIEKIRPEVFLFVTYTQYTETDSPRLNHQTGLLGGKAATSGSINCIKMTWLTCTVFVYIFSLCVDATI